jgi:hypothetical protein
MIEDGAREALQSLSRLKPYIPVRPTTIKIQLAPVNKVSDFIGRPNVELRQHPTGNYALSRGDDWMQAWNQVWYW